MRAHARIRLRCEHVQCEHMRAYANARIRIASHANAFLMRHANIRIRYLGVFRVRYTRICAHSHQMRAHSHRMRSHSHRMRSHRMRMRAFKGNLCVSGTVVKGATAVIICGFRMWPSPCLQMLGTINAWQWIRTEYNIGYVLIKFGVHIHGYISTGLLTFSKMANEISWGCMAHQELIRVSVV